MGPFQIIVQFSGKSYRLVAQRTNLFLDTELWSVKANNHTFTLECNRPLLEKKNLSDHEWHWRLVSGACPHYFLKQITDEIRKTIDWINKN